MIKPPIEAQPALQFIPPAFNPWIYQTAKVILPSWLRWKTAIRDIQVNNLATLAQAYQEFQQGDSRLLLAFRHPSVDDPYCLGHAIWHLLPQFAQQQGIKLTQPIHFHFMYDRGIPLWAGKSVGWCYSRLGGTPIQRGKVDRQGLKSARDLLVNGRFPLAAAPEGATNGHNEIVGPLEPGLAQIAFWGVEDLIQAGRSPKLFILPIGIQYSYINQPWERIEKLLTGLEMDCGIPSNNHCLEPPILYQRLLQLATHLLTTMEEFYQRFYQQNFASLPPLPTLQEFANIEITSTEEINEKITIHLQALLHSALSVAENYFHIPSKGNFIDRCRRLEQAGWDYIYRDDIKDVTELTILEKSLANRIATEASLRMWNMRIVESFVAVTGKYVKERVTPERFAETTLLLWDMINKIKSSNTWQRPRLGEQRVNVTIGTPIAVYDRWSDYQNSRRQTVAKLTSDLYNDLSQLIIQT